MKKLLQLSLSAVAVIADGKIVKGSKKYVAMVLGLLAIAAIPTTIGVTAGVSARKTENSSNRSPKTEAEQMRKFNLECYCENASGEAGQVQGGRVVLRDNKLFINLPLSTLEGHPFEGFYIGYPDPDRPQPPPLALVSTISKEPPMLNWIYVDKNTRELRYGNRTQSRQHIVGSWGWDAGEVGGAGGLTLEGREGAVAVETEKGWEIRWEDGVGKACVQGSPHLMVSLERRFVELTEQEKREQSAEEERIDTKIILTNTTLDESYKTTGTPKRVHRKKIRNGNEWAKE